MADTISIAELLARSVAVEWFEAVSLVREVCSVFIAERIEESTPDVAQILLASSGRVTITGAAHADAPVRRLGQLLQALLLRSGDSPVTLRLVLSEAVAVPAVYASVSDLDAALAYFERPDRSAVLRALYQRTVAATPDSSAAPVSDLDSIVPLPPPPSEVKRQQRKPANRRATALVAAVAVVVAGVAFAYQRGVFARNPSLKVAGARATAVVDKAVFATVSAVTEMAGMGKLVEPGVEAAAAVAAPIPAPAARRHAQPATPIVLAGMPVKVFDLEPAAHVEPATSSPDAAPAAVLEASAASAASAPDVQVYGPNDPGIVPPQAIRPHLPTTLPEGISANQLARIDLTVSADGLVESVKLVPGSRAVTVSEAMLLSAAKTWRFTPALKDGRTVRYRKTVLLSEK